MEVNVEDKSAVKKVLHCEVAKEDIKKELDKAYGELRKTANISGFRKGKVPRKVLENRFSKDVHADVAPRLIQQTFSKALEDNDLKVIGSPQLDPPDLDPESSYKFDITVEVKPEIEDIEFEGLSLEKSVYEVSEDEIEGQIYMIRKTMATKKSVTEERAVKADDFVLIDYQGFIDGEPFDKTPKIENFVMGIGSKAMPEEFSRMLTGVIPEADIEIEVPYPDDYYNEDLAGKKITYQVKVKEIQEEVLPDADDNLVKELGHYETLDDVKAAIRSNLEASYEKRVQQELNEQIFQHLLEKYTFEVPETMIDSELEGIIKETEQAYAQNNMSLEDAGLSSDKLKEEYRDVAEKQARRHLLLDKIIMQEEIDLTDQELNEHFQKMAEEMNASVDGVRNYFESNKSQFENFKYIQLEKKAVDLIISKSSITHKHPDSESGSEKSEDNSEVKKVKDDADTVETSDGSGKSG